MIPVGAWYRKAELYLEEGLWKDEHGAPLWRRMLQFIVLTVRDFFGDQCILRASALTYATLLSVVPLLALMFSLLKGLGVQNALEPVILEQVAVGSEEVVHRILDYIDNVQVGRLGVFGLVALIVTVLTLLSNIEKSFNRVWGVSETRPLRRRFADYFSVVTVGPVLLLAAISMTSSLKSQALVQHLMETAYLGEFILLLFGVLPYVTMWAVFSGLYIFMPNARVSYQAALVGGIVGGSLWQLAQWGYITFQVGIARFNAIYGTMAALPVFMVWIYVSWTIVLFGLEVAYVYQYRANLSIRDAPESSFTSRQMGALAVLCYCVKCFMRKTSPPSIDRICSALALPPRMVGKMVQNLIRLGFLSEVMSSAAQGDASYLPAVSPENLRVVEVLRALRSEGEELFEDGGEELEAVLEAVRTYEEAAEASLGEMSLAQLATAASSQG